MYWFNKAKQLGDHVNLSLGGNMCGPSQICPDVATYGNLKSAGDEKVDESAARRIILQKQWGGGVLPPRLQTMNIFTRLAQKSLVRTLIQIFCQYPMLPLGRPENSIWTQGEFCRADCQNKRSSWHRAPEQNHQGQYRNRYPLQQNASDIKRQEPCIRAFKEEQEA